MIVELSERRMLGALRVIDSITGLPIVDHIAISGAAVHLVRNSRGDWVILEVPGCSAITRAFQNPPAVPAIASVPVTLRIVDLTGQHLPREIVLQLPRDPRPEHADTPESLFQPVLAHLYPAPNARNALSWAMVRATIRDSATSARLPWALIRVFRNDDNTLLGTGLADNRGEALIVVPGILISMPSEHEGPVVTADVTAKLTVRFDRPAVQPIHDAEIGQASGDPNQSYLPNPDALSSQAGSAASIVIGSVAPANTVALAAGRILAGDIVIALP